MHITAIDPQDHVALSLLREAATEVRPLYGVAPGPPWPDNAPLGPRDLYVAGFVDDVAVACGALRELDATICEVRRMYVRPTHRRQGLARAILRHLSAEARRLGYARMRLETGDRQPEAITLYTSHGFSRIEPFGEYAHDPTSVCFELSLHARPINIRRFHDGDAPYLWHVFYSAIHGVATDYYSSEQVDAWAPETVDIFKWDRRMRAINPFVAERDGTIVGYADVQANGYIDHFFVASEAGRQGVGSRLMQQIHDAAAGQLLTSLFANVSLAARPFFERWGFVVEREQSVTVSGVAITNFLMRKRLRSP